MKIENPYTETLDRGPANAFVEGKWHGWNEGYHSRDEVVDKLVEACERAEFVLHSSTGSIGLDTAAELREAIAKAKP